MEVCFLILFSELELFVWCKGCARLLWDDRFATLFFCFGRLVTWCNGFGGNNVFADEIERPLYNEFVQIDMYSRPIIYRM